MAKSRIWKQMAEQAGLVVTLISIATAIFVATQYFASQEDLVRVENQLKRQLAESACRSRMIREILDSRIQRFEADELSIRKYQLQERTLAREGSKEKAPLTAEQKKRVDDLGQEIINLREAVENHKQTRKKLEKILQESTVLSDGKCKGET